MAKDGSNNSNNVDNTLEDKLNKIEVLAEKFAQTKTSGVKGWQPIIIDGIYSYATMRSYTKECVSFANWVRDNFAVKDIEVAKTHVDSYLKHRMSNNDSAWTLKLIRSALRKVYNDPNLASNVNLPDRKKEQITWGKRPQTSQKLHRNDNGLLG